MTHKLKIYPEYFESVISGKKCFEVRRDDRETKYSANDILILQEHDGLKYTGRTVTVLVTHVLRNGYCKDNYCIMSIKIWRGGKKVIRSKNGKLCCPMCKSSAGLYNIHSDKNAYCGHCGTALDFNIKEGQRDVSEGTVRID